MKITLDSPCLHHLMWLYPDSHSEPAITKEPETESWKEHSLKPDFPYFPAPGDAVLGTDVESDEPVALPYQTRDLGVTVLGQTGYGKTTLLEQLILQDIEQGTAVIVIDAHGDLTRRVLSLADTNVENLLLLEAWEDAPFRLNLFECTDRTSTIAVDRTVSAAVQVFKRLFGSPREYYPRLERDLGNAARTVIANQGTLLDVPRLFWDDAFRVRALKQVTNRHVHEFWAQWERIGRADRRMEQLEATINRLDQFLSSEFVAQAVGSTTTTIPFDEALGGTRRVLLLSLPVGEIGEGLCNLLGSLFLAVLTERIFARARLAPEKRSRVHLYLDEYGRYATPTTAQLLTEGRKFGIGTTIAHQTRAQIPDAENRAAELQVGTLLCFQLIGEDATELSGEFRVTPEPQWEEPVEEIEGEEAELAVPPNTVEHLVKSGHPDPLVRETVRTFLVPLLEGKDRWKFGSHWSETCRLTEKALADAMEQRITDIPTAVIRVLCDYWPKLARYFLPPLHICPAAMAELNLSPPSLLDSGYRLQPSPEEKMRWENHMYYCVRSFIQAADATIIVGGNPVGGPHDAKLAAEMEKIFNWYCSYPLHPASIDPWTGSYLRPSDSRHLPKRNEAYSNYIKEMRPDPKEWVSEFLQSLGEFVYPLLTLLHRLVKEPLLVPTGRFRPRKRIHYITHPQRSYQDVQNELAVELASLPRFTAYCNVHGEQHRVSLNAPTAGNLNEGRIGHIRKASRVQFGRSPDEGTPETLSPAPDSQTPVPKQHQGKEQKKDDDDTPPSRRDSR